MGISSRAPDILLYPCPTRNIISSPPSTPSIILLYLVVILHRLFISTQLFPRPNQRRYAIYSEKRFSLVHARGASGGDTAATGIERVFESNALTSRNALGKNNSTSSSSTSSEDDRYIQFVSPLNHCKDYSALMVALLTLQPAGCTGFYCIKTNSCNPLYLRSVSYEMCGASKATRRSANTPYTR